MTSIFIRNDDVRNTLDSSLVQITEICLKNEVPISHAVEPANVSQEVVDWLVELKKGHPHLIEIIQHGYDHKIKYHVTRLGKVKQGEFGGNRPFKEQYDDLKKGYDLMNRYFGEYWYPILTLPYGAYNNDTLKAIKKIGFKGLSTSVNFSLKHRIKDRIGHLLNVNFILYRKISYHMKRRPGVPFFDVGVSTNIIRRYIGEDDATHLSNQEIIENIYSNSKFTQNVGILLHHRYHKSITHQFSELIKTIKQDNKLVFKTIEDIICQI